MAAAIPMGAVPVGVCPDMGMGGEMSWELRIGSCLDPVTGLASLADKSVDHVITDPPYDEHTHGAGRRGHTGYDEKTKSRRATFNGTRDLGFDAIDAATMAAGAVQFARVTRRWVLVFCAVEMIHAWRESLEETGLDYVRTAIWRKTGSTPQFTGDRPAQACEAIVIAHPPGRKRWNGGGRHGFYEAHIVLNHSNEQRVHTTQKPLALMEALVRDFTDPGELICDPFAGSGTTGVAARRLGRRFVGWELDPKYAEVARRRIGEAQEQGDLFTTAKGPRAEQLTLGGDDDA